jgi:hypothetical protein
MLPVLLLIFKNSNILSFVLGRNMRMIDPLLLLLFFICLDVRECDIGFPIDFPLTGRRDVACSGFMVGFVFEF